MQGKFLSTISQWFEGCVIGCSFDREWANEKLERMSAKSSLTEIKI